jgi:hypothetical protein
MFYSFGSYYYIVIGLAIYCGVHSYRRGTLNRWIFWLVLLPFFGSVYYLFSEVFNKRNTFAKPVNYGPKKPVSGLGIKKLEEALRFSDTFNNRVNLADAYLAGGHTEQAIALYRKSLAGAFDENEHVMQQLIVAYNAVQQFHEIIPLAKKLQKLPQFNGSRSHVLYAIALENLGESAQAEKEFKLMMGRYSNFEQRYQYGLFLQRAGRDEDARQVYTDILNEEQHLSSVERRSNRAWFAKTREELRGLMR